MKNKYETVIKTLEEQLKEATPKTADNKQYLDFGISFCEGIECTSGQFRTLMGNKYFLTDLLLRSNCLPERYLCNASLLSD